MEELKKQQEEIATLLKELDIMSQYEGEDKVISSHEAVELFKEDGKVISVNTKLKDIDDLVGGFREGQLIVISAPTGQGKTTFAQTLTLNFLEQDVKSLWFSYEVGFNEFIAKFEELKELPLFFLPRTLKQNSVEWLERKIVEGLAKHNTKVVFIDHLHYLLEMEKMAQAKNLSLLLGMMMRDLKHIALKYKVIIFLVSHMRKATYESGKMPEIDDLIDSSFVGQESDIVIFLKRKKEGEDYTNFATLKVAKNRRTGNLGTVKLELIKGRFYIYDEYINSALRENVSINANDTYGQDLEPPSEDSFRPASPVSEEDINPAELFG